MKMNKSWKENKSNNKIFKSKAGSGRMQFVDAD